MPQLNGSNTNVTTTSARNSQSNSTFVSQQYPSQFFQNLYQLKIENRFCDVEISVGDDEEIIKAHRIVLSSASPYFEAMFRSADCFNENRQKRIRLHSINSNILKQLIDFIYTGKFVINQVIDSIITN